MITSASEPKSQSELAEAFQAAFASTKNSHLSTALYAALAAVGYFGSTHVLNLIYGGASSVAIACTVAQLVLGLFLLTATFHALARWQAYKRILQVLAKVALQVPESLQTWFYSQVYGLAVAPSDGCSEGFHSVWSESRVDAALALGGGMVGLFLGVFAVVQALNYQWFEALSAFSLAVTLVLFGLALLPRTFLFADSPEAKLQAKAVNHFTQNFSGERIQRLPFEIAVPRRLRGMQLPTYIVATCLAFVSFALNYWVHTTAQETSIDTAFVRALTSTEPQGTVAQAQAARAVALRPRIWSADGVRVVPHVFMVSNSNLRRRCTSFEVGNLVKYFFVCADSLTPTQTQAVSNWASHATPQAVLALQTVPPVARGFAITPKVQ